MGNTPQFQPLAIIIRESRDRLSKVRFLRIRSHDKSNLATGISWNVNGGIIDFGENLRTSMEDLAYELAIKPEKELVCENQFFSDCD